MKNVFSDKMVNLTAKQDQDLLESGRPRPLDQNKIKTLERRTRRYAR